MSNLLWKDVSTRTVDVGGVASSHSADMARRLPNARLTIYPDSGHSGVFQHHEKFVPTALAFLNGSGETPR